MDAYQRGIRAARKLMRYHTIMRERYIAHRAAQHDNSIIATLCSHFAAAHNDRILRYANHVRHIEGLWRRPKLLRRQAL